MDDQTHFRQVKFRFLPLRFKASLSEAQEGREARAGKGRLQAILGTV